MQTKESNTLDALDVLNPLNQFLDSSIVLYHQGCIEEETMLEIVNTTQVAVNQVVETLDS